MQCFQRQLQVQNSGRSLQPITTKVQEVVAKSGIELGLCTVFIEHTSASLIIQENADPAVLRDLERWLTRLAPEDSDWEHADEGPDDMPAHARSAITKTSESIPIRRGRLVLGTWQGLFLWEHRSRPHLRRITVHVQGLAKDPSES
jgi:secondary thiamine-phosphate synthase enzyme